MLYQYRPILKNLYRFFIGIGRNEWKNIPVGYSGNFIDPLLEEIVKGRQQNSGEEGLKAGKISTFLDLKFSYQSNPCCIKIRILLVLEFRLHNLNYKWNIFHLEIHLIVFWIINLPHFKTFFTSISSFKKWCCSVAESCWYCCAGEAELPCCCALFLLLPPL